MCCFSRAVKYVSGTRIYARGIEDGRQILAYSMNIELDEDLAMILPLPVPPRGPDDAVRFIDLSGYADFFDDIGRAFPEIFSRSKGPLPLAALSRSRPRLAVHAVGDFEASYVPSIRDFDRLDPRFRLPPATWDKLPLYRDYGFAVFKLRRPGGIFGFLKRRRRTIHPMVMDFPRRNPSSIFFPTVHVHDGEVHAQAHFDHSLYCQVDAGWEPLLEWERSSEPIGRSADAARAKGILDGGARAFRRVLHGTHENRDIELDVGELRARVVMGERFLLRIRDEVARSGAWYGPQDERPTFTASDIDAIKGLLGQRLSALTEARRGDWGLTTFSIDLLVQDSSVHEAYPDKVLAPPDAPCQVKFWVRGRRIEPQEISLAFLRPPPRAEREAIAAELRALLDEVTQA